MTDLNEDCVVITIVSLLDFNLEMSLTNSNNNNNKTSFKTAHDAYKEKFYHSFIFSRMDNVQQVWRDSVEIVV